MPTKVVLSTLSKSKFANYCFSNSYRVNRRFLCHDDCPIWVYVVHAEGAEYTDEQVCQAYDRFLIRYYPYIPRPELLEFRVKVVENWMRGLPIDDARVIFDVDSEEMLYVVENRRKKRKQGKAYVDVLGTKEGVTTEDYRRRQREVQTAQTTREALVETNRVPQRHSRDESSRHENRHYRLNHQ